MASLENSRKHEISRTAGSAVQASRTGCPAVQASRTGCQPVPTNARAARSTNFYHDFPDAMATASEHFFSRFAQADVHTRNLPHWAANKSLIFITYRLADSMPAAKLREWQGKRDEWMCLHPEPWDEPTASEYYETFPAKLDEMLDAGYGSCMLGREDCRSIVVENLLHFNGERYVLHSFVVMPNHVHVLLEIARREDLARIVHGWKSYTAKRINAVTGGEGQVWQREYYDRLIRNAEHYARTVEYIRQNARMVEGIISRTAGPAVQTNARAARSTNTAPCTTPSRTAGSAVQVSCTGCQPVPTNDN